jgi:hypothetical protein
MGGVFVMNQDHWFLRRAAGLEPTEEKKAWSPSRAREALRAELALMLRSSVSAGVRSDLLSLAVEPLSNVCDAPDRFVTFWEWGVPITQTAKDVLSEAKALMDEYGTMLKTALQQAKEHRARAETWEQEERRASRMAGGEAAANVARENAKMAREKERDAEEYAALFRRAIHGG